MSKTKYTFASIFPLHPILFVDVDHLLNTSVDRRDESVNAFGAMDAPQQLDAKILQASALVYGVPENRVVQDIGRSACRYVLINPASDHAIFNINCNY